MPVSDGPADRDIVRVKYMFPNSGLDRVGESGDRGVSPKHGGDDMARAITPSNGGVMWAHGQPTGDPDHVGLREDGLVVSPGHVLLGARRAEEVPAPVLQPVDGPPHMEAVLAPAEEEGNWSLLLLILSAKSAIQLATVGSPCSGM